MRLKSYAMALESPDVNPIGRFWSDVLALSSSIHQMRENLLDEQYSSRDLSNPHQDVLKLFWWLLVATVAPYSLLVHGCVSGMFIDSGYVVKVTQYVYFLSDYFMSNFFANTDHFRLLSSLLGLK